MTSGPIGNVTRATLGALVLILGTGAARAAEAPFTQLMALLAAHRSGTVTFVARTYAAGLTRPLVSSGVLRFRAPDHLEQRTLKPVPSEIILDGEHMTVRRGGQTHRLNVRAYPDIAVYVDALRATLDGRGRSLRRQFTIGWHGTLSHWQLTLRPLQAGARVRQIRLAGAGANIQRIEILAPKGARTVLRLSEPAAP
ncbi:MAG: LolA family protein [Steroidobacteraceae bacterium]